MNNMNTQTCMNSNRFKASKHALVSPLIQKQVENMDHYKVMDMHAPFYHETHSQLNNSNMQAWIMLYINMHELKHDLALQFNMDHARISSNTRMRRWNPYLSLGIRRLGAQICNLYFNYQAILQVSKQFQVKTNFSPSLLSRSARLKKGLRKCLFQVYTRLTCYIEIVATRGSLVNKANLNNWSIFNLIYSHLISFQIIIP